MHGEPVSDDEEPRKNGIEELDEDEDDDSLPDDAAEFGLKAPGQLRPDGVEDEDDFIMDDDLVATDSEADMSDDESDAGSAIDDTMAMDEEDADFLKHVMPERKEQPKAVNGVLTLGVEPSSKLAFTYKCPRTYEELLSLQKGRRQGHLHRHPEDTCALSCWTAFGQQEQACRLRLCAH